MYEPRTYRHWVSDKDLVSFSVTVKETDLLIRAQRDLEAQALAATKKYRSELEQYIISHPAFTVSLEPLSVEKDAPPPPLSPGQLPPFQYPAPQHADTTLLLYCADSG